MQQRCDQRQQVPRHLLVALRGRMNSISLHAAFRPVSTLEQEGKQGHVIFPGQQSVRLVELMDVIRTVVRRQGDAPEHHLGPRAFECRDDLIEVLARTVDRQSAKTVIAAESNNDDSRLQGNHLIHPFDAILCRVAADPRVHNMVAKPLRIQIAFQKIGITVPCIGTVPCSKAVSESDNDRPIVAGRRFCHRNWRRGGRRRRRSGLFVAADSANTQSSGERELQAGTARVRHTFNLAAPRRLDEVAKHEGTA
jgi:hypothetical protein